MAQTFPPGVKRHTLWIGEVDQSGYMTEEFLRQSLGEFTTRVTEVKLIRNKVTGFPIGYGFIEFSTPEDALECLQKLNGQTIPNSNPPRAFRLNFANLGSKGPEFSIFVGDLDYAVTDDMLRETFAASHPSIIGARVITDEDGRSRGYGFVRFSDQADQERAIREMSGVRIGLKHIRVNNATPKTASRQTRDQAYVVHQQQQQQQQQAMYNQALIYQYQLQNQQQWQVPGMEQFYQNGAQFVYGSTGTAAHSPMSNGMQSAPMLSPVMHHAPVQPVMQQQQQHQQMPGGGNRNEHKAYSGDDYGVTTMRSDTHFADCYPFDVSA